MHILVSPISGGAFPVQLGFFLELAKVRQLQDDINNIAPFYDIAFAASGGNIATYIALAGNFTREGIEQVVNKISPHLFLSSWWPRPFSWLLPSWLLGYYSGSIYTHGSGVKDVFGEFLTPSQSKRLEIWSGTLNCSTSRAELFTNITSSQESKLDITRYYPYRYNTMPLHYLNHDIQGISQVTYASAAIPVLVPNVPIGNDLYADGGTCFSSPLTPLQDCIPCGQLHIDYVNSYNLEIEKRSATFRTLLESGGFALAEMIKSLGLQDRLNGIRLISRDTIPKFEEGPCYPETLLQIFRRRKNYQRSMLELYPSKEIEISLEKFTPIEVIKAIDEASVCMMYRLWWVE